MGRIVVAGSIEVEPGVLIVFASREHVTVVDRRVGPREDVSIRVDLQVIHQLAAAVGQIPNRAQIVGQVPDHLPASHFLSEYLVGRRSVQVRDVSGRDGDARGSVRIEELDDHVLSIVHEVTHGRIDAVSRVLID